MSYEGYVEYLCTKGHRSCNDAYEDDLQACPRCGGELVWHHAVDQTNGVEYDENGIPDPHTIHWPLEQIGEETETIVQKIPLYRIPPTTGWSQS